MSMRFPFCLCLSFMSLTFNGTLLKLTFLSEKVSFENSIDTNRRFHKDYTKNEASFHRRCWVFHDASNYHIYRLPLKRKGIVARKSIKVQISQPVSSISVVKIKKRRAERLRIIKRFTVWLTQQNKINEHNLFYHTVQFQTKRKNAI